MTMAEYIERKAADNALSLSAANDKDKNRRTWAKAICVLHDLPAADVAPVVRCKDCWYSGFDPEYGKRWCERCWGSMLVQDDDFCSYGEKREDRHE